MRSSTSLALNPEERALISSLLLIRTLPSGRSTDSAQPPEPLPPAKHRANPRTSSPCTGHPHRELPDRRRSKPLGYQGSANPLARYITQGRRTNRGRRDPRRQLQGWSQVLDSSDPPRRRAGVVPTSSRTLHFEEPQIGGRGADCFPALDLQSGLGEGDLVRAETAYRDVHEGVHEFKFNREDRQ